MAPRNSHVWGGGGGGLTLSWTISPSTGSANSDVTSSYGKGDKHQPGGSLSLITDLLLGLKSINYIVWGTSHQHNGMLQS